MAKYRTKIKAQINIYKEIEVEADDYISAKQQIMQLSSKMLDDSREVIENNDKDIKRNMSYWSYNKIEEINKGEIIMNKARFYTKIVGGEDLTKYNNQIVEIIDSKTIRWDTRYTIRFKNGKVVKNIMENELDFDI